MIDESVAFALAQREADRRRAAYWACGIGLFACCDGGLAVCNCYNVDLSVPRLEAFRGPLKLVASGRDLTNNPVTSPNAIHPSA